MDFFLKKLGSVPVNRFYNRLWADMVGKTITIDYSTDSEVTVFFTSVEAIYPSIDCIINLWVGVVRKKLIISCIIDFEVMGVSL